ncbi:hypothetical protein F5888DRAFT_1652660 [Russula emetica]|nr:hypothetical protein F5888DRAFT_1652660 [Russula emetica]
MSMSKVLSSDSSEHSTPLSDNKGRRGTNIIPLLSSVSVLDNADNNNSELSARQPSPNSQSPSAQPSTSPTGSFSKYTRRPSLAFQQQNLDQDQERHQQGSQPPLSPGTLARHGIKVRDFAYESNLPLIPSIPRARKVVLGARPLKRTRHYFEEPDDVFTVDTHSQSQSAAAGPLSQATSQSQESDQQHESVNRSRPLERKSTEPVIIPERESQRPYRDVGHADFSQNPSSSQAAQRSPRPTLTPTTPIAVTRTPTKFSPVSLPFPFPATKRLTTEGGSQESELSTDTPLVTPKGPLTWPSPYITSDLPASQLDNNNSQAPALDTMPTYSQLGFSPSFSQAPDSHPDTDTATVDAALGGSPPTTEVVSSVPQPSLDHIDPARGSSPPSPSPSPSRTRRSRTSRPLTDPGPPLTPDAGGPRYFLRKHGSPGQDRDSSPSLRRRRKSTMKALAPYPGRVPPVTRQSAHAASSNSPRRSARERPLRKATTS